MARQEAITAQYDRVAPWYRALSPLFLINPLMRRKAVAAMALRPGDAVLEVGVGSGRNLPYLLDTVDYERDFDAVLFSLSYSVIPADVRPTALDRAWERLRPGGRLVVLDGGVARTRLRPIIAPIARQLTKLGPGNPDTNPIDDLARLGEVVSRPVLFDIYFVYTVVKEPG